MIEWNSTGLFFDEAELPKEPSKTHRFKRAQPPIPDTGWTSPESFPNLSNAKAISFDTETYDPNLLTHGPGWATGDGHVVGISVAVDHTHRWYFPMRHEVQPELNMNPDNVLAWARDAFNTPDILKIGANLMYDIGWLRREGVKVAGRLIDVQFAEPLLDEHRQSYSLNSIARHWLGESKTEGVLYDWLYRAYGGKPGRTQAANIHRSPVTLAGPYAESDADLPFRIWELQQKALEQEGLIELFELECRLIPLLVEMRWRGSRVDVSKAAQTRAWLTKQVAALDKKLGFNVDAPTDLVKAFNKHGIPVPKKGDKNTFEEPALKLIDHDLCRNILARRRWAKARTSIENDVIGKQHNGYIHGQFHPLRADEGGTVSGRFSSSLPNLQNFHARDTELKLMVRGLFIPEDGCRWGSADLSQIEYRLMVHAARGPGAEEARQRYRDDPSTDYHVMTQMMLKTLLGREVDRKPTKNINFGKIFGMGKNKLIAQLGGLTQAEAVAFFEAYEEAVPYAKPTADAATRAAQERGYIRTVLGRRARFPLWEPAKYYTWEEKREIFAGNPEFFDLVGSREAAVKKWGPRVKRAKTHKALNAYTQGSGADMLKKAMVVLYEDFGIVPINTVHDELNINVPEGDLSVLRTTKEIMENAVQLKIPVISDAEIGPNWAELGKVKFHEVDINIKYLRNT